MLRAFGAFLLFLLISRIEYGQNFDFEKQRQQIVELDGKWRFHIGDNPRWADSNFDDRSWSLLRSDENWGRQGYKGYGGFAWYRFHLRAEPKKPLALLIDDILGSFQVFVNGRQIGAQGKFPPHGATYVTLPALFELPPDRSSASITIAVRVWFDPVYARYGGGGLNSLILLGTPELMRDRGYESREQRFVFATTLLILSILEGIAGFTALALFAASRSGYELLWFALMQLFLAARRCGYVCIEFLAYPLNSQIELGEICFTGAAISAVLFYSRLLRVPLNWLAWAAISTYAFVPILRLASFAGYSYPRLEILLATCKVLCLLGWMLWTLGRGLRRRLPDASLLLAPTLLAVVTLSGEVLSNSLRFLTIPVPSYLRPFEYGAKFGFLSITAGDISDLIFLLSVLAILIGRFTRIRREEERHARELEAARTVQQVLVPEAIPAVPGFSISSVYQPDQQLGGDFFQIIPLASGLLVAIGDVSGKGLPAAMTVSLIVGTLRTLAEQTESPAEILRGLNRRLAGRSGFTTCLIARLRTNGDCVLANVGHLPPYRNGEEVETVSNLPLGLSLDTDYVESAVALQPNDTLTFISDGVVEAKSAEGELFGFDRTRRSSTQPADAIAKIATQFGQQDDITVLTIKCLESELVA